MRFTVQTGSEAEILAMYAEKGRFVKSWKAEGNSTQEGDLRVWNLDYEFTRAGKRTLTFRASLDGETYGEGQEVEVEVTEDDLPSGKVDRVVSDGKPAAFSLETEPSAEYVCMFSDEGQKLHTWDADKNTVLTGGIRGWVLTHAFKGPGIYTVTFRASVDGRNYGLGKTMTVKVTPLVFSVKAELPTVTVKQEETFNLRTDPKTTYLAMHAENGKSIKVWRASGNSTVSGGVRNWKVRYAFLAPGNRRMFFKASLDGKDYGAAKEIKLQVIPRASAN